LPVLSLFAMIHLLRHVLVYLYFSRHLYARHLRWMLAAFTLALVAEGALGLVQYKTGLLKGVILDPTGSERREYEYEVPGIEGINRATGTSYDSHSFGTFMTMLLPFPLVVLLSHRRFGRMIRFQSVAAVALGALAIFVSFSRSAWRACAMLCAAVWLLFLAWREKGILMKTAWLTALSLIPLPWAA